MKKYITSDDRERIINKLVDDKFNSTIKELKVSVWRCSSECID